MRLVAELFWDANFQRKYAILMNSCSQMGIKLDPKLEFAGHRIQLFCSSFGRQGCPSSAKGAKKVSKMMPKVPKMK